MPRILTVDDSRTVRLVVRTHLEELGVEVDEAENGKQGLRKLAESSFDLVLLDINMPDLDGPTMLRLMRERGDRTPVLMLTSQSSKSTMVELLKLGIEDYVLKPFQPHEIKAKVKKVLNLDALKARKSAPTPTVDPDEPEWPTEREGADILIVDDMPNVESKFRKLVPDRLEVHGALDKQSATTLCRKNIYKAIVLDTDMPDTDHGTLLGQLRVLQPGTPVIALCMRTRNHADKWAKSCGYDDVLYKPFTADSVAELLMRLFEDPHLVVANDNLVRVGSYDGPDSGVDKYLSRVIARLSATLEQVAAACFEEAIVDISNVPLSIERTPRFVLDVSKRTEEFGLVLRIVGPNEGERILQTFTDTSEVPYFTSVAAARSAG